MTIGERGESGARGDSGERGVTGESGVAGERGDSGQRGVAGERGMKGDHGQHGEKGDIGRDGVAGPTGPIGRTGPTSPYLGRNQTLAIFTFIVVAFVLLAYRTETVTDRTQQDVYQACLARAEIKPQPDCEGLR